MHSRGWACVAACFSRVRRPRGLQQLCADAAVLRVTRRTFLVRFHETPNEACYKFFVDDVAFLSEDHSGTLRFDLDNCFQSPLAEQILHNLPMVEEVTIGQHFVTVRRVDDDNAAAAARYFAMKLGTGAAPPDEAAQRSAALQQRVTDAMNEHEHTADIAKCTNSNTTTATTSTGSNNTNNDQKEEEEEEEGGAAGHIDEAAIRDLLLSTHWSELKLHVSGLITDHLFSGRPHVDYDAPYPHADTLPQEGDSEVVLMLKELIAKTIRPQLQLDGGDIRFVRLDGIVVYVEMLGACRRCKSSKTTLRDLIERTIRHWIPEVQEVCEVESSDPRREWQAAAAAAAASPRGEGEGAVVDGVAH